MRSVCSSSSSASAMSFRSRSGAILFGVLFVGGLILVSIGIAGEYLARIYTEVKDRPKYLIAKTNIQ